MLVSEEESLDGVRVIQSIGTITAASDWRPRNYAPAYARERENLIHDLINRAEDIDADAIFGLNYRTDTARVRSEGGIDLERTCATGIAVRLALAA